MFINIRPRFGFQALEHFHTNHQIDHHSCSVSQFFHLQIPCQTSITSCSPFATTGSCRSCKTAQTDPFEHPTWSARIRAGNNCSKYTVTFDVLKYIEHLSENSNIYDTIQCCMLNRYGYLYDEPQFLLQREIRKRAVLPSSESSHPLWDIYYEPDVGSQSF